MERERTRRRARREGGRTAESDLVRRAKGGDPLAFEALFERHRAALEVSARRLLPAAVRRKVSVSDVVQEARIAAFGHVAAFEERHEGAVRGWLVKIVERKALEAVRRYVHAAKRAARTEESRGGRADTAGVAARDPSPSQVAIANELRARADRALRTLSEDDQRVLHLTRVEGLTLGQAAERMDRSREATKKLYGRALVRFAEALDVPLGRPRG